MRRCRARRAGRRPAPGVGAPDRRAYLAPVNTRPHSTPCPALLRAVRPTLHRSVRAGFRGGHLKIAPTPPSILEFWHPESTSLRHTRTATTPRSPPPALPRALPTPGSRVPGEILVRNGPHRGTFLPRSLPIPLRGMLVSPDGWRSTQQPAERGALALVHPTTPAILQLWPSPMARIGHNEGPKCKIAEAEAEAEARAGAGAGKPGAARGGAGCGRVGVGAGGLGGLGSLCGQPGGCVGGEGPG